MLRDEQSHVQGQGVTSCRTGGGIGARGAGDCGGEVAHSRWRLVDRLVPRAIGRKGRGARGEGYGEAPGRQANAGPPVPPAPALRSVLSLVQLRSWSEAAAVIAYKVRGGAFGSSAISVFVAVGCIILNFFLAWGTLFSCSLAVAAYAVRPPPCAFLARRLVPLSNRMRHASRLPITFALAKATL